MRMTARNITREEVRQRVERALAPFPELQKIFDRRWLKTHVDGLSERQLTMLRRWAEEGIFPTNQRCPHLLLLWALLPLEPNPMLRALNDAIAYLRCMGVRHLDRKIAALKSPKDFWQTLSEIYLATHFQRAGASVKEFDPPTSDGHQADFAFTLDDWSGVVEVHTVTPKETEPTERLIGEILDPLEKAVRDWRKKKGQLASKKPTNLRLFAQSVNLMEAEAQLLFLARDLFALLGAQTICQQAFEQGLDAIALFAIDHPSGLIWAIRWHWRPDRAGLPDQFPAFRDYPKRATMLERAVLKIPNFPVPILDLFQATLLDYYEDVLLSPSEAVEAFNSHWLYKSHLTFEEFLHLAYEHGIPYFRMTEEEWRAEAEAMRWWERRDCRVSR
jgi:hypothetical protein